MRIHEHSVRHTALLVYWDDTVHHLPQRDPTLREYACLIWHRRGSLPKQGAQISQTDRLEVARGIGDEGSFASMEQSRAGDQQGLAEVGEVPKEIHHRLAPAGMKRAYLPFPHLLARNH